MSPRISTDELVAELRELAESVGGTPTMADMDAEGRFSPSTYQQRFGSWNEAVAAAGLQPNESTDADYGDDELVADLRGFADEVGHTPSKRELREAGPHSPSTYAERFGSWSEAVAAAGLQPNEPSTTVAESALLADLRRVTESLGRVPTRNEFAERGEHAPSTYDRRFGSWSAAVEAAGLADRARHAYRHDVPAGDLLAEVERMADVLGRAPTATEMDALGDYSERTYRERFGSWSAALREAGHDAPADGRRGGRRVDDDALLADLRDLADRLGRPPKFEEMWKEGEHSPTTYRRRFGSWSAALSAAGFEPRRFRSERIPERRLVRALRRLASQVGGVPRKRDMDEAGRYSGSTYYNRYGSWADALATAGLDPESGTVAGACDGCGRRIERGVETLDGAGLLFCGEPCRTAWTGRETVRFESLLDRTGSREAALSSFASLLDDRETPVAEVLVVLRHALALADSDFEAASAGEYRVSRSDDRIAVAWLDPAVTRRFTVDAGLASDLADRVEDAAPATAGA